MTVKADLAWCRKQLLQLENAQTRLCMLKAIVPAHCEDTAPWVDVARHYQCAECEGRCRSGLTIVLAGLPGDLTLQDAWAGDDRYLAALAGLCHAQPPSLPPMEMNHD